MRALVCQHYGPPSDLIIEERPAPTPRDGEVLIETAAVGLGYVDALLVAGRYQVKTPLPFVPGSEISGRVIGVGYGVDDRLVGTRVLALAPRGALAEQVALPASACTAIPDTLSSEAAAGLIVNYCTALYGLRDCGAVQSGEHLLVLGAGGGVGMAAIDIARVMGMIVIAAASTADKRAAALTRGATAAIDYSDPEWRSVLPSLTGRKDVDVVWDPVGGDISETALRCLAPGGRHLVVGFAAGSIPRVPLNLALLKRCAIVGVDWGGHVRANTGANAPLLATLMAWINAGQLRPEPGTVVSFEEAPTALQSLLDRGAIGKPVVRFTALRGAR
jgi:NADPH2:quinone reductase